MLTRLSSGLPLLVRGCAAAAVVVVVVVASLEISYPEWQQSELKDHRLPHAEPEDFAAGPRAAPARAWADQGQHLETSQQDPQRRQPPLGPAGVSTLAASRTPSLTISQQDTDRRWPKLRPLGVSTSAPPLATAGSRVPVLKTSEQDPESQTGEDPDRRQTKFSPTGVSSWAGEWYVAHNVCLDLSVIAPLQGDSDYVDLPLAQDGPELSMYRHLRGTLLIVTVAHGFPYNVYNIGHLGERAFPMFEALEHLKSVTGEEIDTVLAWQYRRLKGGHDWYEKILQLLGDKGLSTTVIDQEKLLEGVCAPRVLTLMKPWDAVPSGRKWTFRDHVLFTNARSTKAFRERTLQALGSPLQELTTQRPKCVALVVAREPPQGWRNIGDVNMQLGQLLARLGWSLRIWQPAANFTDHPVTLKEQVSLFADVALSIMNVAAQNTNMVFQPPGSAVLVVHKCGDGSFLPRTARDCGLSVFEAFPADCLERPRLWNVTVNELGNLTLNFKLDLEPSLREAVASLQDFCIH